MKSERRVTYLDATPAQQDWLKDGHTLAREAGIPYEEFSVERYAEVMGLSVEQARRLPGIIRWLREKESGKNA